ncbi:penicillin acylase family protein [Hazenella sp. IB182357]|uniref:Penicillin acylase family protein n=1 Tax=Polycladospora coralii TaxID=2771432 RepID=A0A926NAV9_9BACL|nr:penicillin acylase family protein [Polycladospora coralii]MBD1373162.1 penicillin acylase family protein [Polycladospora coralii]
MKIRSITALCLLLAFVFMTSGNVTKAEWSSTNDQFMNIMPPGQDGVINTSEALMYKLFKKYPKHTNDQTQMYEKLSQDAPGITEDNLQSYFKGSTIESPQKIERTYTPTEGLTIRRDHFGVPHIAGDTRAATMFGVGYATAEDRLFLMDVLRHLGRAELSSFLGDSEANREMDLNQLKNAPYREEELQEQIDFLCEESEEGKQACEDLQSYTDGVNAYIKETRWKSKLLPVEYVGLFKIPKLWKKEDSVAIASFIGGVFGKGGGNEVASGVYLSQLKAKYGNTKGESIWEDFKFANDSEAPTTTLQVFPYNDHHNIDPASTALLDLENVEATMNQMNSSTLQIDGPYGPIPLRFPDAMSNAILVSGEHTKAGHPIAVFGPQTSYYSPQMLMEMAVDGPGIYARGVGFVGINFYVQMGHGKDYAWSATSSNADNVDQWIIKLCSPDGSKVDSNTNYYEYKGKCTKMDIFKHSQMEVQKTVYGPVVARGTVAGKPVAVATQRSTYGNELKSAIGFQKMNNPTFMEEGVSAFQTAVNSIDYTFNWFYVDDTHISYKHSGLLPIRNSRTNPDLPTWGTGEYDWTGTYLSSDQQPHETNPDRGYLISWNNKQAPAFRSNDANFSLGPVHRSDLLEKRIKQHLNAEKKLDRADVVNLTMDAATVDLKGQEVYPYVLEVLGDEPPVQDERLQKMRDYLAQWVANGGHRRDFSPLDGKYDDAVAVAIADEAFDRLLESVFPEMSKEMKFPQPFEDSPRFGVGSAFLKGGYAHLNKDLRQVLNQQVESPFHQTYCGKGNLQQCRLQLWNALQTTANQLTTKYGSSQVQDWKYDANQDDIKQTPLGLLEAPQLSWVNRPTFQQVVQIVEE